MKKVLILFILLIKMNIATANAIHATADVVVSFGELQGAGPEERYTIAVIRLREQDQALDRANQNLARELLTIANNWSVDIFRNRYTHHPAEKFEAMRRAGIKLNKNSSFIMAFKTSEPDKPLGTLWTAYPDSEGKIDLERSLDWMYPRPEPRIDRYPMLASREGIVASAIGAPVLTGGVVELKRLVLDPKSPRELMPALLLRGESSDHLNTQPLAYVESREHSDAIPMFPAEYALRCDYKLIPIYLRFGFKLVNPDPIKEDHVMKIDRADYVRNAAIWTEKARQRGWSINYGGITMAASSRIEISVRQDLRRRACLAVFSN